MDREDPPVEEASPPVALLLSSVPLYTMPKPIAEYGLGVDLIRGSEARSECEGIVMRDVAVAAAGSVAVVDLGAGDARQGMDGCGREIRSAAKLLLQERRVVVSQSIIQRESPGHFPGVLGIDSKLLFPGLGTRRAANGGRSDLAQQETGIAHSHVGAAHCDGLERLSGLFR